MVTQLTIECCQKKKRLTIEEALETYWGGPDGPTTPSTDGKPEKERGDHIRRVIFPRLVWFESMGEKGG